MKKVLKFILFAVVLYLLWAAYGETVTNKGVEIFGQVKNVISGGTESREIEKTQVQTEKPGKTVNEISVSTTKPRATVKTGEATKTTTTSDWRQFLVDYEEFVDSYIVIYEKYKNNPTDLTILKDYSNMLNKVSEFEDNYDVIFDEVEDLPEYTEFTNEWLRIHTKMIKAISK